MIEIYRGESKSLNLTFTNDDGTPFNLSGYSIVFTAGPSYKCPVVISGVQNTYTSAESGMATFELTTGQTDVNPFDYIAQFNLVSGNDNTVWKTDGLRILPSLYPPANA